VESRDRVLSVQHDKRPRTIIACYKKNSAFEFEKIHADEISEYLIEKDSVKFWRAWNSYNRIADTPVCVGGKSDPVEIANEFKSFFGGVYVNSADDVAAVDEFAMLRRTVKPVLHLP
jgi:hypothetical protein